MPWAIEFGSVFNDFCPGGELAGYDEQLAAFHKTATDLEECERWVNAYRQRVSAKFHSEIGVPLPHEPALSAIKPQDWPSVFRLKRTRKRLGSLISTENRILAVDDALKAIIETVEPGVHLFNPLQVVSPKREEPWGKYHVLVVSRFLTSFRRDQTNPEILKTDSSLPIWFHPLVYAQLAMSSDAIGNAHLWRERGEFGAFHLFLSDPLQAEIAKAGLRLPPHLKLKTV